MEVSFTAEDIIGMAVAMNNGTVPFLGVATILPQGVENVCKWTPSFMFDKVVKNSKKRFEQMGIMETFEFTNLTYVLLKSKYQLSISVDNKITESIFLAENGSVGKLTFESDGTYVMNNDYDSKTLISEFSDKARNTDCTVFLKEQASKPVEIEPDDIAEIFNLVTIS